MSAYLTYTRDKQPERVLCSSTLTIGRDKTNNIVLTDLLVSRNHAMVRRLGGGDYYIIDSGSSNGTSLNGGRVSVPTRLRNGDRIAIGLTEFTFEQGVQPARFNDSISFQQTVIFHSPVIKEITVLVADIRNYTGLSEQVSIQTLSRLMSKWFQDVSEIIQKSGGTIDKFIGDCVFVRWDNDRAQDNVAKALATALKIAETTARLKLTFPDLPQPLRIGAGINTGMASLGIGADNTALGDAVNTAFRLESITKELGRDIALSESSYRHLPRRFWEGAEQSIALRGKKEPVRLFCLDFGLVETVLREQEGEDAERPVS
ncbi:MAG: adenylate/guanylate cyclase domain-containing protein [Gammaproteobacteria bacterium HGW-Gammaproteobacteria-1]|jgi:adenylate cyclase|nr:MAG: adenylate/guanylate cyclase domain-containing protein [Gammaproteobacteria bacterium HGW-Gammaproteobacteria-1]